MRRTIVRLQISWQNLASRRPLGPGLCQLFEEGLQAVWSSPLTSRVRSALHQIQSSAVSCNRVSVSLNTEGLERIVPISGGWSG